MDVRSRPARPLMNMLTKTIRCSENQVVHDLQGSLRLSLHQCLLIYISSVLRLLERPFHLEHVVFELAHIMICPRRAHILFFFIQLGRVVGLLAQRQLLNRYLLRLETYLAPIFLALSLVPLEYEAVLHLI